MKMSQCLQLVRICPYLYGFFVVCTGIRELCSIIRKSVRIDLEVCCDQRIFDLCPCAVPGELLSMEESDTSRSVSE